MKNLWCHQHVGCQNQIHFDSQIVTCQTCDATTCGEHAGIHWEKTHAKPFPWRNRNWEFELLGDPLGSKPGWDVLADAVDYIREQERIITDLQPATL